MESQAIVMELGQVGLAAFDLRALEAGEVLVRAEFTSISPGTELRCLAGGQEGSESGAFVPGYALVGIIEESKDASLLKGQRVFCAGSKDIGKELNRLWGGHCQFAIVDADQILVVADAVDPRAASLASVGAIAYHGFTRSRPKAGEDVICVGLGVIGQLAARIHAQASCNVLACDLSEKRVAMSNAAGVQAVYAVNGLQKATQEIMPQGASLIIDATGAAPVLREALELCRDTEWNDDEQADYRYLIQGSYPGDVSIPYQAAFMKQLSFIVPRARQLRDARAYFDLLAHDKIEVLDLINAEMKPADAAAAYEALKNPNETPGTIIFDWR